MRHLLHLFCLFAFTQVLSAQSHNNLSAAMAVTDNFSETFNNQVASAEAGEPSHGSLNGVAQRSLWYRYVPSRTGFYELDITASVAANPMLAIYRGTSFSNLTLVKRTTSTVYVELTKGVSYLIALDSQGPGSVTVESRADLVNQFTSFYEGALPLMSADEGWEPWEYGKVSLTVAPGGSFTGRLSLGNGSYPFKSKFQPGGTIVEVQRPNLPTVRLNLIPDTHLGNLILVDAVFQPDITQARSKTVRLGRRDFIRPSLAQRYNFVDSNLIGSPASMALGHALTIGTLAVSSKGQVTGSLILPDGTTATLAANLGMRGLAFGADDGWWEFSFHQSLYGGRGQITGNIVLDRTNNAAPVYSGNLHWVRHQIEPKRKLHHRGTLVSNVPLVLAPYAPPPANTILWHNESASTSGDLVYSSLDHTTSWGFQIDFTAKNKVIIPPSVGISGATVTLVPATGFASGSFKVDIGAGQTEMNTFRAYYMSTHGTFQGVQTKADGTTYLTIAPQ